jgi:hypothetical protein
MRIKLYSRRRRTVFLLASGNSLPSVVASVSDDFKCSEGAIYKDISNIDRWGRDFIEIEYNLSVTAGKLSLLYRDAIDSVFSSKDEKSKHQARADALAILNVQINFGDQLGAVDGQPQEVSQTTSVRLPFEANPDIMAAYRSSVEKQRAEKEAQDDEEKVEDDVGKEIG